MEENRTKAAIRDLEGKIKAAMDSARFHRDRAEHHIKLADKAGTDALRYATAIEALKEVS